MVRKEGQSQGQREHCALCTFCCLISSDGAAGAPVSVCELTADVCVQCRVWLRLLLIISRVFIVLNMLFNRLNFLLHAV